MLTFLGERMREFRRRKDITQKALAKALKVSQGQISRYESCEDEPSYPKAKQIADIIGVSVGFLFGETDKPQESKNKTEDTPKKPLTNERCQEIIDKEKIPASEPLPVYAWASCGHGILTDEKPVDFMTKPSNAKGEFWVIARGDSMKPRIQDGYQLLITEDIFDLKNGDIIIFIYDDELCCKYYSYEKGKYIFYGEDPKFPPIVIEDEDGDDRNFNIIGKVTAMAMVIV